MMHDRWNLFKGVILHSQHISRLRSRFGNPMVNPRVVTPGLTDRRLFLIGVSSEVYNVAVYAFQ